MNRIILTIAAAACAFCATAPTHAAIVTGSISGGTVFGTGGFIQLFPGNISVGQNNFDDNNLRAFNEKQNLFLTNLLNLDQGIGANAPATTVAAGSTVSSHFVVFDPAGAQTGPAGTILADIYFDAPILGVIRREATLVATNAQLGLPSVTYLTPTGFALEQGQDFLTVGFGGNANRLRINLLSATSPGDVFRVITAQRAVSAVPEPATWLSMLFGFGLIGAAIRRRSRTVQLV